MDGSKGKLSKSLQFKLSVSVFTAIILVALIAGIFAYWWSFIEAVELQDEQLIRLAALVDEQRIGEQDPGKPVQVSTADPESHFVVQSLDAAQDQPGLELRGLSPDLPEGLQTRIIDQVSWRILVKKLERGERIAVAQQTEVRDELARVSTLETLIPLLLLIPVLLLLLAYLIRQVFAPLKKMAMQLDSASDQDLDLLLDADLATEIQPFVTAISCLLGRVRNSMLMQRQFVRDAAHELRSPLTAISLQAERLIETSQNQVQHSRLVNLHKATERTRILIEQLLTMARVQENIASANTNISLKFLLRDVLEDLLPLANQKEIEISVIGDDREVQSQMMDLHILLKNLIENSIRYTPLGGFVEIAIDAGSSVLTLTVKDSGPGIPASDQERVFDAFYRVLGNDQPGSGLGLSIAKTIADRLALSLRLFNNPAPEPGLSVQVVFKK